jgi:hypothetical protein
MVAHTIMRNEKMNDVKLEYCTECDSAVPLGEACHGLDPYCVNNPNIEEEGEDE